MKALETLLAIAEAVMPNRRFVLIALDVDGSLSTVANVSPPGVTSVCLHVAKHHGTLQTREALDAQTAQGALDETIN